MNNTQGGRETWLSDCYLLRLIYCIVGVLHVSVIAFPVRCSLSCQQLLSLGNIVTSWLSLVGIDNISICLQVHAVMIYRQFHYYFSRLMWLKTLSSGQDHTQGDPWMMVENIDMLLILGFRWRFILVGWKGGFLSDVPHQYDKEGIISRWRAVRKCSMKF